MTYHRVFPCVSFENGRIGASKALKELFYSFSIDLRHEDVILTVFEKGYPQVAPRIPCRFRSLEAPKHEKTRRKLRISTQKVAKAC